MRLTGMIDDALRLLMYLAQQPDRLCTIAEIAAAHGISEAHLMKIAHQLGLAGWIETVRGKGGGTPLAAPPQVISLGAVVRNIEPDFDLVECPADGDPCMIIGQSHLNTVLLGALQSFMRHLDGHTLAELLLSPGNPAAGPSPSACVVRSC